MNFQLCKICNKPAEYTCIMCGKAICKFHFDKKSKVCDICRKGKMYNE